jgi:hypothetical protein
MRESSFKDRFSLDYLGEQSNAQPTSKSNDTPLPPGLEAVLDSVGFQLMSAMQSASDQSSKVLELAQATSTRLDTVMPVLQYLANKGLIERVQQDPTGNDTYRLTLAGANSLTQLPR